jgi:hypothetical protein
MEIIDLRPMSLAPLDGTPVRLLVCAGFAIAFFLECGTLPRSFRRWDYRAGWFLLDDDSK